MHGFYLCVGLGEASIGPDDVICLLDLFGGGKLGVHALLCFIRVRGVTDKQSLQLTVARASGDHNAVEGRRVARFEYERDVCDGERHGAVGGDGREPIVDGGANPRVYDRFKDHTLSMVVEDPSCEPGTVDLAVRLERIVTEVRSDLRRCGLAGVDDVARDGVSIDCRDAQRGE